MNVAYLTGEDLATHSIEWMLQDEYGASNVHAIPASELGYIDLTRYDMLVMPGCVEEVSPYPEYMNIHAKANLRRNVEAGMILWTDCAGTYEVMSDIMYTNSRGTIKTRKGAGYVDARAIGPHEGDAIAPARGDRFLDVVIKRISHMCGIRNQTHSVDVCYGNGPAIYLSAEEAGNPDISVIARYGDSEDAPVAALSKKIGRGLILCFGVLIQISPKHIEGNPEDTRSANHRDAIRAHLTAFDDQRQNMLRDVFARAHDHIQNLRNLPITRHKEFSHDPV